VSELPPGSMPTRHRFLARARLLGALSSSTVVVEAGAWSGSLRVAAEAHRLGRQIGAVPGPVTSVNSSGPHELVRAGTARLVTSAVDVEQLMSRSSDNRAAPGRSSTVVKRRERTRQGGRCRAFSRLGPRIAERGALACVRGPGQSSRCVAARCAGRCRPSAASRRVSSFSAASARARSIFCEVDSGAVPISVESVIA